MSIEENILRIRERMAAAAERAGRDPGEIRLCAATKMNDGEAVRRAIAAGVDCCGENRVQELAAKQAEDAYRGRPVHFIGRLQTNKVHQVVGRVALIQSVDRLKLMQALEKEASKQGIVQDILLEVNIGGEASKGGFSVAELWGILEKLGEFPHLQTRGLMAIPPVSEKSGENIKFFQEMFNLSVDITGKKYDNIKTEILSMGMTDDFEDAIACGSTMIRLGSAIFGPRNYAVSHQR